MADDEVIDVIDQSGEADSKSVLDLIMVKPGEAVEKFVAKAPEKDEPDDTPKETIEEVEETVDEKPDEEAEVPDNIDDYVVEVTVDGKAVDVALKDLKKSYSGLQYIDQNIHKAVEARKAAENQANVLYKVNEQSLERLQQLGNIIGSMAPSEDWETLKKTDPNKYLMKREEFRENQEKFDRVQSEIRRVNEEQADIQAHAKQRYLDSEAETLIRKLPELADSETAPKLMGELTKAAAEYYGYTKAEVDAIVDHRAMLILNDAFKYRNGLKAVKEPKEDVEVKKIIMKPSSSRSSSASTSAKRLNAQILSKAQQSGRPEDVAATLIVRKRK